MASPTVLNLPDLAKERDVEEFTGVSTATLRRWRAEGIGPKAIKLGRSIRYRKADLLAWLDSLAEAG